MQGSETFLWKEATREEIERHTWRWWMQDISAQLLRASSSGVQSQTFWRNTHPELHRILLWSGAVVSWCEDSSAFLLMNTPLNNHHCWWKSPCDLCSFSLSLGSWSGRRSNEPLVALSKVMDFSAWNIVGHICDNVTAQLNKLHHKGLAVLLQKSYLWSTLVNLYQLPLFFCQWFLWSLLISRNICIISVNK